MALKNVLVWLVLTMAATSTSLPCRCRLTPIENGTIADCANQDLKEVPSCVPNDTTIFDFSGNIVAELNTSLTTDKRALRQLNAHRSHVTVVAANAFSRTPELRKVELAHNNIHQLPAGLFDATPFLEVVDLSGNMLRSLPRGLLKNAPHLRRLDLSFNYLSFLPGGLLGGCGDQAILRVATNHLTALPADLIDTCPSLVELDASANQLAVLQADVQAAITHLPGLRTLLLRNNPWQCDCTLSPLAELLRTHEMDEELTCGGPPAVKDLHVVHAVSDLDCAPLNATAPAPPVGHAPYRGHGPARPATSIATIVVVVAVASCCALTAVAAFFIKRHRSRQTADRFSLLVVENS